MFHGYGVTGKRQKTMLISYHTRDISEKPNKEITFQNRENE